MRVLIVEDDPFVALDLESIVLDSGAEVEVAHSLADARLKFDSGLDFAFLDIDLPDGRGFEAAMALRARNVPFAFVTGSARDETPPALRDAPFIAKPFKTWQIERWLPARDRPVAAE